MTASVSAILTLFSPACLAIWSSGRLVVLKTWFRVLLRSLQPDAPPPTLAQLRRRVYLMDVKLYDGQYLTFWDMAFALAHIAFRESGDDGQEKFVLPNFEEVSSNWFWLFLPSQS